MTNALPLVNRDRSLSEVKFDSEVNPGYESKGDPIREYYVDSDTEEQLEKTFDQLRKLLKGTDDKILELCQSIENLADNNAKIRQLENEREMFLERLEVIQRIRDRSNREPAKKEHHESSSSTNNELVYQPKRSSFGYPKSTQHINICNCL
ncbi:hypothetical protein PROFUN_01818 [Planoprotostelium fungivorum]|uniref:Uncharacterized protein n=1 Tax=Planoprotostelium fungivorum TaxID=1890364 RepID=A0A2P6NYV4_9EUKA|nr:hypothetical protein PROFUN_01818 [Planoprotostelium fungivorum]